MTAPHLTSFSLLFQEGSHEQFVLFKNKTFKKILNFVKLYGLKRDFNHDFKKFDIFLFNLHNIFTNVKQYSRGFPKVWILEVW